MLKNSESGYMEGGYISTTKKITGTAVFTALAFVATFLEFPLFPQANFLKLDFANVFICISGFLFGPVWGVFSCVIKELLCLSKSSSGGIGELSNAIITLSFILVPAITYKYKKGINIVIITLLIGCVLQTLFGLVVNKYINFPLYMGSSSDEAFKSLWKFILFFNLIKSVAISVLTVLVYKKISTFIKRI